MQSLPIMALILAAGASERMGRREGCGPKPYHLLGKEPLVLQTVKALQRACPMLPMIVVIHPSHQVFYEALLSREESARQILKEPPLLGGSTRQLSVYWALHSLRERHTIPKKILIHDAARPFVSSALMRRLLSAESTGESESIARIPVLPVVDSLRDFSKSFPDTILARESLRFIQTPQLFDFQSLVEAHQKAFQAQTNGLHHEFTDDSAVMEWAGYRLDFIPGDPDNFKLTYPEDWERAEKRMHQDEGQIRVGQGFDVHAFGAEGAPLWLGGIKIEHMRGLSGHSDADVLLHAITDGILGALAEEDIGAHFPPSDPQWKDASSSLFLHFACSRLKARGAVIQHVDTTLVCEEPRIHPYRQQIRENLAKLLSLPLEDISVKATTSERLGFTGRKEGIAAFAVVTLRCHEIEKGPKA